MDAIILTGGQAKPLSKLLDNYKSRSLIRILGTPLIEIILKALVDYYDSITVVYDDVMIPRTVKKLDSILENRNINLVEQVRRGVEGAICSALIRLRDENTAVTIIYGDVYSIESFYQLHAKNFMYIDGDFITITVPYRVYPHFIRFSIDENGLVNLNSNGEYIYAGMITVRSARYLREIVCKQGKSLKEYISFMIREQKLHGIVWYDEWVDLDTPWDYLVANQYSLSRVAKIIISSQAEIASTAIIEPPVVINANTKINPYAVIKGPVFIDSNVLVGSHSIVRQGSVLLKSSTVGSHSDVKRTVVMEDAYISNYVYLTDSVIGQKSVIAPFVVSRSIPMTSDELKIALSFSLKIGETKIGASVASRKRISEFTVLEPGRIYH